MDPQSKRFKALLAAIPVFFALLALILFFTTRTRHVFTVYADGDYISANLLDAFTEETGIRVRLVTGDRTPEAGAPQPPTDPADAAADAADASDSSARPDASAPTEPLPEPLPTLPEQLQAPRDEAVAKAREKAEKRGDASAFDPAAVEYPAAEYDVVLTDGATLGTLRERELIQPLTYAKVTNLKNISQEYRKLSYDPTGEYSITTMWEYVGLLVNTNLVTQQIKSWDTLWDSAYQGQVVMPGQMRDALAVTLLAMGEDPATDDSARLNAALDKLAAQRPLVASYSGRDAYRLLQSDQAALYPCWSGDALAMMRENPALVFLLPPGGTYRTTFGYAIPADSRHTEDALTFINFMCQTESLARNAVYSKYASTSVAAIGKLDESWADNPVIYPDVSVLASTPLLSPLSLDVAEHCALRWRAITQSASDTDAEPGAADASAAAKDTAVDSSASAKDTAADSSASAKSNTKASASAKSNTKAGTSAKDTAADSSAAAKASASAKAKTTAKTKTAADSSAAAKAGASAKDTTAESSATEKDTASAKAKTAKSTASAKSSTKASGSAAAPAKG